MARRGSALTAEQEQAIALRAHAAEQRARAELALLGVFHEADARRRTRAGEVLALEDAVDEVWERRAQLTPDERAAVRRAKLAVHEARAARWELAESATRIAFGEARKVAGVMPVEDLAQEGRLGLYRAALRFEPKRGLRFSTYARWWCRASITRAVDQHGRTIRMPAGAIERRRNLLKIVRTWEQAGVRWSISELAIEARMPAETVAALLDSLDDTSSLDQSAGREESDRLVIEVTPDTTLVDPVEELDDHARHTELLAAVDRLPRRQRRIIRLLYGLEDGERRTLADVGRLFKVSRERIRQLRNQALASLLEDLT